MFQIEIQDKLQKDIISYCEANEIKDINKFCIRMLIQGFTIEKHGISPFSRKTEVIQDKTINEVIKETESESSVEELNNKKPKKVKIIKK